MGYTFGIMWTYDLVKEILNAQGFTLVDRSINNCQQNVTFYDSEGYYYYHTVIRINKTKPSKFRRSNPYTIQNIKLWCKLNNKLFDLLSNKYINNLEKLTWQCVVCGEVFKSSWDKIYINQGCPYCVGKKVSEFNCFANNYPDLIKEWHPIKNGDITPYDITCHSSRDIWWQCSKNPEHEWVAKTSTRIYGCDCPFCWGRYPTKENNLLVYNNEICEEWDYKRNNKNPEDFTPFSHAYAWWECKKCNYSWYAEIASRSSGRGCPQCKLSNGEDKIMSYLKLNNIVYKHNKTFHNLVGVGNRFLSYDFFLSVYNLLIEYQGEQHERYIPGFHESKKNFLKQQEHDRRKKEYAKNNNIELLEIWYWDFDNIEEILNKKLNLKEENKKWQMVL